MQYLYADGQGISGTRFEVIDTSYEEVVAGGVLDEKGQSHVDLPITVNSVKVCYLDDPIAVETLHESTRHIIAVNPNWFERMMEGIKKKVKGQKVIDLSDKSIALLPVKAFGYTNMS